MADVGTSEQEMAEKLDAGRQQSKEFAELRLARVDVERGGDNSDVLLLNVDALNTRSCEAVNGRIPAELLKPRCDEGEVPLSSADVE